MCACVCGLLEILAAILQHHTRARIFEIAFEYALHQAMIGREEVMGSFQNGNIDKSNPSPPLPSTL